MTERNLVVRFANRRGASLWEIMGCIAAVGAGLWLGARYLGFDLNTAAYTALSDSEVIEKLPEDLRPAPPPGAEPQTPEEVEQALGEQLAELRQDLARLNPEPAEADRGESDRPADADKADQRLQATVAYWTRLAEIADEVQQLQRSAERALDSHNVYQVLDLRRRAYDYGVKAIKAIDTGGADPQVVKFAGHVSVWFTEGAELYREAQNVWQSENLSAAGVTSDRLLQHVRQQHTDKARLLMDKSRRLRQVLAARYQAEFPPIYEAPAAGN